LNNKRKNSLNLDFEQLKHFYPFSIKSISKLKLAFGVQDKQEIAAGSELKQKFEELISTGKYTTLRELAEATGYSHSYVCRVLKHKK
jgi:hypothetical protein